MTSNFDAAWDAWAKKHPQCSGFRYEAGTGTVECCDHPGAAIPAGQDSGRARAHADRPDPPGQDPSAD